MEGEKGSHYYTIIEALDMMWYRPDNTNIDRGDRFGRGDRCFII